MMEHKGTKQLETQRLILRRARAEDAKPMYDNWASDPDVTTYLTWPIHGSVDVSSAVIESWIECYEQINYYQWMIVLKEINEPIGSISVVSQNDRVQKAEIGYCIGKSWWHQGIMSEALKAVMDYLFDEVGMNRLEAKHDPRNPHSGGVMKKCGMKYEGTTRQSEWNNQGLCDVCHYSMLASERVK